MKRFDDASIGCVSRSIERNGLCFVYESFVLQNISIILVVLYIVDGMHTQMFMLSAFESYVMLFTCNVHLSFCVFFFFFAPKVSNTAFNICH